MKYISKKQKILLIVIISIITIGISYYAYAAKLNEEISIEKQNEELEIEEEKTEESEEEKTKQETKKIIVHVSGAIKNEGIYELEENSRVANAIEAAGGITENAYTKEINLALALEDGMKIYIPTKEEAEKEKKLGTYNSNISGDDNNSKKNSESSNKGNEKININTATREELDKLPGVGEATADKIINYREANGEFKKIEEIKEVKGIGDSKFEEIKDLIEV